MTPNPYSHRAIRSLARLVGVMSSLLLALLLLGANPLLALTHATPASHIWASTTGTATLTIATETRPAGATGFPFAILAARWGGEGSGDGQFNLAAGVAVDLEGNVYVADSGNNRIQK